MTEPSMKENGKLTAIVFGSSGLTGRFLTELLLKDPRYGQLILFVRKESKVYHGRIKQVVFNPADIGKISNELAGDQVFCCIGTTIKKAGSQDAFYNTDHDLVIEIARTALLNQISVFSVISSIGADPKSGNFYLRTKGEMEYDLKKLGFGTLNILRPSLLLGLRAETRLMEDAGKFFLTKTKFLFTGRFRKYRPIHAETVARALIRVANENSGTIITESDKIEELGLIPDSVS